MGNRQNHHCTAYTACYGYHDRRSILMIGMPNSGKNTILRRLSTLVTTTKHMIGFDVNTIHYKNYDIHSWDICQPLIFTSSAFNNMDGLIMVIDSTDRFGIDGAYHNSCQQLHSLLQKDELKNINILIFANKQDVPNIMSMNEIQNRLQMTQYIGRPSINELDLLLNHLLPVEIIKLLQEFIPETICAPCRYDRIVADDLNIDGLETYNLLKNENDDIRNKIQTIICQYLPPYKYENGSQKQCKIIGCTAINGNGIEKGLNWMIKTCDQYQNIMPKKQCLIM